jgi:hypothetical protein
MAVVVEKEGGGGAGNAILGLVLGAVLVIAGIVGFFMWDGYKSGQGAGAPAAIVKVEKK